MSAPFVTTAAVAQGDDPLAPEGEQAITCASRCRTVGRRAVDVPPKTPVSTLKTCALAAFGPGAQRASPTTS